MQHSLTQAILKRGCNVTMRFGDLAVRCAFRNQMFAKIMAGAGVAFPFIPGPVEMQYRDPDRAIRPKLHSLFEERAEPPGVSIGSQPHDLVFIGVEVKAKMQRNQGVQDPDRVIGRDLPNLV